MGWSMSMVTYFPTTPTHVSATKVDAKQVAEAISSATSQSPFPPPELNSFNNIQTDKEAFKIAELTSNAEKKGVKVLPEPKGRPVFMFFLAKVKHKGVK